MTKPKLIMLSGPLGIGKTTLAKRYADEHALAMCLDIDELRKMIGGWREHAEESGKVSKKMAEEIARVNLEAGYDVIIPQIYRKLEHVTNLEVIALESNADFYELLLDVPRDEAIKRFMERGGFHKGGLIEQGGGIAKLESMYDEMTAIIAQRPKTIKIVPEFGDIDATYDQLILNIS